jgi:hypothetical protein
MTPQLAGICLSGAARHAKQQPLGMVTGALLDGSWSLRVASIVFHQREPVTVLDVEFWANRRSVYMGRQRGRQDTVV